MFERENDDKDLSWAYQSSLGDAVNVCVIVNGTDAYKIYENHSICPPLDT